VTTERRAMRGHPIPSTLASEVRDDLDRRAEIEALLQERAANLGRTREAMHRSAQGGRDSEVAHIDNHPADVASELHDEELDETTDIMLDEEETRIEEARRALADGSYGTCLICKRPIAPERLKAVPEAVRCLDCQRRFEGDHRQRAVT
jgi:RNA polymerase-binding transcription factor DksA